MKEIDAGKSYLDFSQFAQLKSDAKEKSPEAIKQVAKQFEGIFLQMALKSMRDANAVFSKDNFLNSQAVNFYQDMCDKEMTNSISQKGGLGLADVLVRQLSGLAGYTKPVDPSVAHITHEDMTT